MIHRIWPLGLPFFLLVLGSDAIASAQNPVTGRPLTLRPRFDPGDVLVASKALGPGFGGIARIDGPTGACTIFSNVTRNDSRANVDFDSFRQRLVVWGPVPSGVPTNNSGDALNFVDAAGAYSYYDMPPTWVPKAVACTTAGRIYLQVGARVLYLDQVHATAPLQSLLDTTGTPYDSMPNYITDGWSYDEASNCLIAAFRNNTPGPSVGIQVLPLSPDGTRIAKGETRTMFWQSTPGHAYTCIGLSPVEDRRLLVGIDDSNGSANLYDLEIDRSTLMPSISWYACFYDMWRRPSATTYSWIHDAAIVLDSLADELLLLAEGSTCPGVGVPYGGLGCVSSPGGLSEFVSMETIPR